jgi:hypothetical protein
MAFLIQDYPAGNLPSSLLTASAQESRLAYYQSFSYPIFALRENLLRFPDAEQVESWRWTLAYDLALTGSPEAGEAYAALIADNLNRLQVDLDELYAWFPIREPRLAFFMVEAPVPPGYNASYLIELRGEGGSAFIWLLEKAAAYEAYNLLTRFDFVNPRQANWIFANLDNVTSNGDEIAIYFSTLVGESILQPPQVFSLAKGEPLELKFLPDKDIFPVGMDFLNHWALQTSEQGENELVFDTAIYPPCPLDLRRSYRWNGLYFELDSTTIAFGELPTELGLCEPLIDQADHYWGPEAAVSLMETLLPDWSPATDAEGEPYPADALDSFKYRLGMYKALSGEYEQAIALFNEVSTVPVVLTSGWIEPAQSFLAAYQKPEDIYIPCVTAQFCDPSHAIRYLAEKIPNSQDAFAYLRDWGVEIVSSGYFDFDDDDESERWFTVRNAPRQKLDFWILARAAGYHQALPLGLVEARLPTLVTIEQPYLADEGLKYQPAVLLDGRIAFSMQRLPDNLAPYLVSVPLRKEYPSHFFVPLESYRAALLAGASSPELIQSELENLAKFPGLLCETNWSCDEYYYLLGLASELANDGESAVEAYQYLWLNYSRSPFTAIARLKLALIATPPPFTSIPSQTIAPTATGATPFPTATLAPTVSDTPQTPTPTISGTPPTATPSFTPTPTISGTPPTATLTPSPTSTTSGGYPGPTTAVPTTPYP